MDRFSGRGAGGYRSAGQLGGGYLRRYARRGQPGGRRLTGFGDGQHGARHRLGSPQENGPGRSGRLSGDRLHRDDGRQLGIPLWRGRREIPKHPIAVGADRDEHGQQYRVRQVRPGLDRARVRLPALHRGRATIRVENDALQFRYQEGLHHGRNHATGRRLRHRRTDEKDGGRRAEHGRRPLHDLRRARASAFLHPDDEGEGTSEQEHRHRAGLPRIRGRAALSARLALLLLPLLEHLFLGYHHADVR